MGVVATVKGPVDVEDLGITLMHEHIFILSPDVMTGWDTGWDRRVQIDNAVKRLLELERTGVGTIVDLTVPGIGRNIELIREVAEQVELNIIVATGYYTYDSLPHYFRYRGAGLASDNTDKLDTFMLGDIEAGIEKSGIMPGILKCATDSAGITPDVERVLRAVARVHKRTGLPISTHTDAHTERGLEQQRIFLQEGVDLTRTVIGHCGDTTDIDYLTKLLEAGSTIGMDRFGLDVLCPQEDRIDTVARLCELGWAGQVVISQDAACHIDWFEDSFREAIGPKWGFTLIYEEVLPGLRERGVPEDQIETMLVENPRRILDSVNLGAG